MPIINLWLFSSKSNLLCNGYRPLAAGATLDFVSRGCWRDTVRHGRGQCLSFRLGGFLLVPMMWQLEGYVGGSLVITLLQVSVSSKFLQFTSAGGFLCTSSNPQHVTEQHPAYQLLTCGTPLGNFLLIISQAHDTPAGDLLWTSWPMAVSSGSNSNLSKV